MEKRIFVGNLFPNVTSRDLEQKFREYGSVTAVDIRHKKDGDGEIFSTFAYVNLNTSLEQFASCLSSLANTNWKGQTIKLELAKENFLTRLQREREEVAKKEQPEVNNVHKNHELPVVQKEEHWLGRRNHVAESKTNFSQIFPHRREMGDRAGNKNMHFDGPDQTPLETVRPKKRLFKQVAALSSSDSESESEYKRKGLPMFSGTSSIRDRRKEPQYPQNRNDILRRFEMFSDVWKDADDDYSNKTTESYGQRDRNRRSFTQRHANDDEPPFEDIDDNDNNQTVMSYDTRDKSRNSFANENGNERSLVNGDGKYKGTISFLSDDEADSSVNRRKEREKKHKNNLRFEDRSSPVPMTYHSDDNSDEDRSVPGLKRPDYFTAENEFDSPKYVTAVHSTNKRAVSEEKRLKALSEKSRVMEQQQNAIKKALASEFPLNKKKRFDSDEEDESCGVQSKKKTYNTATVNGDMQSGKHTLFHDSEADEEVGDAFNIQPHYEGEKGQKLIELQSRFGNDERFRLDQRFAEVDDETGVRGGSHSDYKSPLSGKREKLFIVDHSALRFDPDKAMDTQHDEASKKKKKKTKAETEPENPLPEVSKDYFYQVSSNLVETLKDREKDSTPQSFSLLKMLGRDSEEVQKEEEPYRQTVITSKKKDKFGWVKSNPFKYDSSDSEEEGVEESRSEQPSNEQWTYHEPSSSSHKRTMGNIWRENFFFVEDGDERLKEGLAFFNQSVDFDALKEKFVEERRELKQILKTKVKNTIRRNRPWKKKVGGKPGTKIFKKKW